jgi:hypothetical protein
VSIVVGRRRFFDCTLASPPSRDSGPVVVVAASKSSLPHLSAKERTLVDTVAPSLRFLLCMDNQCISRISLQGILLPFSP